MLRFNMIISIILMAICINGFNTSLLSAATPQSGPQLQNQLSESTEKKSNEIEEKLEKQIKTYCDAQIFRLIDEKAESHFNRLDNYYKETKDSFEWLITCAAGLFVSMIALAMFLFWKSDKSLKEHIDSRTTHWIDEIKSKLKEFDDLKKVYETAITENEQLKVRLKSLTAYKHKKIIWAYETQGMDASAEIEEIHRNGFTVTECDPGKEKQLTSSQCDFLIYSYQNSSIAKERLELITEVLSTFPYPVPLIIYTFQSHDPRIPNEQMAILSNYRNYILSNMPLTLKSHFNSLIRN